MRVSQKIKNKIDTYVIRYAKNIANSQNPILSLNKFDYEKAAYTVKDQLLTNDFLSGKDVEFVENPDFLIYLMSLLRTKILAAYLCLSRPDMTLEQANRFIVQNGTAFYSEFDGCIEHIPPNGNTFLASEAQIKYLDIYIELDHLEELTSREASFLIKCCKSTQYSKPFYWSYFVKNIKKETKNEPI